MEAIPKQNKRNKKTQSEINMTRMKWMTLQKGKLTQTGTKNLNSEHYLSTEKTNQTNKKTTQNKQNLFQ